MNRAICIILLLCSSYTFVSAQALQSDRQLSADLLIERIKSAYSRHCCFKARFDQMTVNVSMDMKDRFKGDIYVKKPRRIALKVKYPEKQHLVMKGRVFTVYFPSDGSVVHGEAPPELNVDHFFGFLAGLEKLDKNFKGIIPQRAYDERSNLYFLELADKNNIRSPYQIIIGIDMETFFIKRAVITDALGNYNRFDLSRITLLSSLPESIFKVEKKDTKRQDKNNDPSFFIPDLRN